MNALEVAMKMETDAVEFYTEALQKVKYPAGKKMLEAIIGDEKRHIEMVSQLIKGLNISSSDVSPKKKVKTIFESMKNEMMQKMTASQDEMEAFKVAMTMEKEGVAFYKKALAEAATDKEKALFKQLVAEEEQHYALFANTCQYLKNTGAWFMWEEGAIHAIIEG
jgi:rubrerythrin